MQQQDRWDRLAPSGRGGCQATRRPDDDDLEPSGALVGEVVADGRNRPAGPYDGARRSTNTGTVVSTATSKVASSVSTIQRSRVSHTARTGCRWRRHPVGLGAGTVRRRRRSPCFLDGGERGAGALAGFLCDGDEGGVAGHLRDDRGVERYGPLRCGPRRLQGRSATTRGSVCSARCASYGLQAPRMICGSTSMPSLSWRVRRTSNSVSTPRPWSLSAAVTRAMVAAISGSAAAASSSP